MQFTSCLVGLVFARFSRPISLLSFSDCLITTVDMKRYLMFRLANGRSLNHMIDAHISVTLAKDIVSSEGVAMRKHIDVKLTRDHQPVFTLLWLVVHEINEDSPLHGCISDNVHTFFRNIVVTFNGYDTDSCQMIYAK